MLTVAARDLDIQWQGGWQAALIFNGSTSGLSSAPSAVVKPPAGTYYFGWYAPSLSGTQDSGMVNGDGWLDLLVGGATDLAVGGPGEVYVHYGGSGGFAGRFPT